MNNIKNMVLAILIMITAQLKAAQPYESFQYRCINIDGEMVCFENQDCFVVEDENGNIQDIVHWNEDPNTQTVLAKLHDYVEKTYDQKIEINHIECAKILSSLNIKKITEILNLKSITINNLKAENGCKRLLAIQLLIKQALESIMQQLE